MARYPYQSFIQDGNGRAVESVTVTVYEADTTTLATIYAAKTGGSAITGSYVTTAESGYFIFYVDSSIYAGDQLFDIVPTKSGYSFDTIEDVVACGLGAGAEFYYPDYNATDQGVTGSSNTIKYYVDTIGATNKATIYLRHNSGSANTDYTFSTAETITSNITLKFENGARLAIATGITVTINGGIDAGLGQIFSCTGTGKLVFGSGSVSHVYVDWYGITNTNDNAAFVSAIASTKLVRLSAREYTITAPLDSLTSDDIRISGPTSAYKTNPSATAPMAIINLDNTALAGSYVSGTDTITYTSQLKLLNNAILKSVNSAKYGIIGNFFYASFHDLHFDGFDNHGIWSVGSVISSFEKISGYEVGTGRTTAGALNVDTFIDGCLILAEASTTENDGSPHPSGEAGNHAYCRVFSSYNYSSTLLFKDIFAEFAAATTTSFKTLIAFNVKSLTLLNVQGYNGVWLGYCEAELISPHLEVYATGGAVAADAAPYALVTLNTALHMTNQALSCSPANPAGNIMFLRTTAFSTGTDYWGYDIGVANKRVFSRAHIAELQLGDYKPNTGSYAITRVPGLGSVANPILTYDSTTGAVLASKGTTYTPVFGVPLYKTGTVSSAGNVDVDASVFAPSSSLGGVIGNMIYDVEVQVLDNNFGRVHYHGTWRAVRQGEAGNYSLRFYCLGYVDNNAPAGGFTVTEDGAGPYTLRIANGTAWDYTYTVYGRAIGVASAAAP